MSLGLRDFYFFLGLGFLFFYPVSIFEATNLEDLLKQSIDLERQAAAADPEKKKAQQSWNILKELEQTLQEQRLSWWNVPQRWNQEDMQRKLMLARMRFDETQAKQQKITEYLNEADQKFLQVMLNGWGQNRDASFLKSCLDLEKRAEERQQENIIEEARQNPLIIPSQESFNLQEYQENSSDLVLLESMRKNVRLSEERLFNDLLRKKIARHEQILERIKARVAYLEKKLKRLYSAKHSPEIMKALALAETQAQSHKNILNQERKKREDLLYNLRALMKR